MGRLGGKILRGCAAVPELCSEGVSGAWEPPRGVGEQGRRKPCWLGWAVCGVSSAPAKVWRMLRSGAPRPGGLRVREGQGESIPLGTAPAW